MVFHTKNLWRIKSQHINDLHVYAFHAALRCRIQAVPKNIVPSAPKNGIAKIDVNICEISEIQGNTYLLQMKSNGLGQEVWKELTILPEIP